MTEDLPGAIEAILMVSADPVSDADLACCLGASVEHIRQTIEELRACYEGTGPCTGTPASSDTPAGGSGGDAVARRPRGFTLQRSARGTQFVSAAHQDEVVARFLDQPMPTALSTAALETLAIIAYRQPISRSRMAAIRGVNVDGVVRTLTQRGLIADVGIGANGAVLYGTTDDFLTFIGVDSLDELTPLAPYLPQDSQLDDLEEQINERLDR